MPPSVWHFTLHDSSPLTLVTVFRQNLSRAGKRMCKRTSEGKRYHFLRSGWGIICLSGENKPVRNLLAYLGHWHDVKCWHRIGQPWEPEWLTVLTSLDRPMLEGTRRSQPEQQHWEEKIAALEQTGTNPPSSPFPLLIFLFIIDLSNKWNLDMDLKVTKLQINELTLENPENLR